MDYKTEIISLLNESLINEENEKDKLEITELIEILNTKSLYAACIHNFLTLASSARLGLETYYSIPEVRQAFYDLIRNPDITTKPENKYWDMTWLITGKFDPELFFKYDPNFLEFIESLDADQADELLTGERSSELLDKKEIYDIMIKKAQKNEKFYKIFKINQFTISDGSYKEILKYDKFGRKLSNVEPEILLQIIPSIEEGKFDTFLRNLKKQDDQVQRAVILNPYLREQIILLDSDTKSNDTIIPELYLETIIKLGKKFIKELSFEKKYNFIIKIENPEIQKELIQEFNILENLDSLRYENDFYSQIKDTDYLVEYFCREENLNSIDEYELEQIILKFNDTIKEKLMQNTNFQNYLSSINSYNSIKILAHCGENYVDEYIQKNGTISTMSLVDVFTITNNHKYIEQVFQTIAANVEEHKEAVQEVYTFKLLTDKVMSMLTEAEFEQLLEHIHFPYDLEDSLRFLNNRIAKSNNNEKDDAVFKKQLSNVVYIIAKENNRIIKELDYGVFYYTTPEETKLLLERATLDCLLFELFSCDEIANYCYELYEQNPNIFDNVTIKESNYITYEGDNLSQSSLQKGKEIYKKLNKDQKIILLNETLMKDEEIISDVINNIHEEPNYYRGETYGKTLQKLLPAEELEKALYGLNITNFLEVSSSYHIYEANKEVFKKVISARKDEMIHELNHVKYDLLTSNVYPQRVISNMIELDPEHIRELLSSLNLDLIIGLYYSVEYNETTKITNKTILKIIESDQSKLVYADENKLKDILSTLSMTQLRSITSNLNIDELLILFSKTKNKDLEEQLMVEFDKKPNFINPTDLSLEEILSKLEPENKNKIYSSIDKQYQELELPYNIKDKLRKLSYDEKLFLIYGVKNDVFNEEKYKFIDDLLSKDPFALNTLSIELLQDDIFNASKNIIPKIYRFQDLTRDYIELLKQKNHRSKIMLLLIAYLEKTNTSEYIYTKKLDCILKHLINVTDINIDRFNLNNITEEELILLEEYILYQSRIYYIENNINYSVGLYHPKDLLTTSLSEAAIKRNKELDEEIENSDDINIVKNCVLEKIFKININHAELILQKYDTSLSKIEDTIKNKLLLSEYKKIKEIFYANDIEQLKQYYFEENHIRKVSLIIEMFEEFDIAYNNSIANNITGYKNGQKTNITLSDGTNIEAIELLSDFNLIVHSTDAYGSMEMINDNYFDSWNYSEKTANHGICTSFISNSNLGTANVKGLGVMFGFVNLNSTSISSMAPYDLMSRNNDVQTTSNRPPMYTDICDMIDYTRHTHNEIVLERRNISSDSKFPVIQPDCIIIFEEMSDEIKQNALNAQRDFKEQGIDLPIIYINRKKVVELEARKVQEMLNIYESNPNLELLSEIINKYETNKCGLDFEDDIIPEELFEKERIYNAIINTINYIKTTNDKENAIKLINIIEHENSKFTIIKESIGDRAHSFDLLDENLIKELEELKNIYLSIETENTSNFTI